MKLYVIVRGDLPPGAQVAQACHGLSAFVDAYPEIYEDWYEKSNNLVVLSVDDEPALIALRERLQLAGVPVAAFREPDFDDAFTALGVAPGGRRFLSSLPLSLRAA